MLFPRIKTFVQLKVRNESFVRDSHENILLFLNVILPLFQPMNIREITNLNNYLNYRNSPNIDKNKNKKFHRLSSYSALRFTHTNIKGTRSRDYSSHQSFLENPYY